MFEQSWDHHPMGLLFLVLFVLMAGFSLLPAGRKRQVARCMESRAVWFNSAYLGFVVIFLGYGILRALAHLPELLLQAGI
jgi:hypothetical protein